MNDQTIVVEAPGRLSVTDDIGPGPGDLPLGTLPGTAVADNIWGPYKKQPQVFLGGHITVFTGPDGNPWFSYRGESGGKSQGRLCIDPIPFNEDGSVKFFKPSAKEITIK